MLLVDDPHNNLTGNARYEGFCVELIREIAHLVGFNYTIRLSSEGKYGISNPLTGEWNGIVRDLMDRVQFPMLSLFPRSTSLTFLTRSRLFIAIAESGSSYREHDYQLRSGECHRLHEALHESRDQHHVQGFES